VASVGFGTSKAPKSSRRKKAAGNTSLTSSDTDTVWQKIMATDVEVEFLSKALGDPTLLDSPEWMLQAKEIVTKTAISMDIWQQGITVHKANVLDAVTAPETSEALGIVKSNPTTPNKEAKEEPTEREEAPVLKD